MLEEELKNLQNNRNIRASSSVSQTRGIGSVGTINNLGNSQK